MAAKDFLIDDYFHNRRGRLHKLRHLAFVHVAATWLLYLRAALQLSGEFLRFRAAEARGTGRTGLKHLMAAVTGDGRSGEFRRGAAEGDDNRSAERGREMHGSGVVGEQDTAKLE